jgi:hypothetical protein
MRTLLDRTTTIVLDATAPENHLSFFVHRLQLDPDVESVDSATREEVAYFASSHNYLDSHLIASTDRRILNLVEGRDDFLRSRNEYPLRAELQRFFAYRECRRELWLIAS